MGLMIYVVESGNQSICVLPALLPLSGELDFRVTERLQIKSWDFISFNFCLLGKNRPSLRVQGDPPLSWLSRSKFSPEFISQSGSVFISEPASVAFFNQDT